MQLNIYLLHESHKTFFVIVLCAGFRLSFIDELTSALTGSLEDVPQIHRQSAGR